MHAAAYHFYHFALLIFVEIFFVKEGLTTKITKIMIVPRKFGAIWYLISAVGGQIAKYNSRKFPGSTVYRFQLINFNYIRGTSGID